MFERSSDAPRSRHWPLLTLAALALSSCGGSHASDAKSGPQPLTVPDPNLGVQMAMSYDAPPSSETWKCQISTLPQAPKGIYWNVHNVQSAQTPYVHHMDITALVFTPLGMADGQYDCKPIYDAHPELMDKGVAIYSSQRGEQQLTLPDGVVAQVPGLIQVMQEVHYVNTTPDTVHVFSSVNAYNLTDGAPITNTIWGSAVRDEHIDIPPRSEHDEWTECVMTDDIDLIVLGSHSHKLATSITISHFDGKTVGDQFYVNTDWHAPKLTQMDPPMHVKKGEGFHFNCHFNNVTDNEVHWGQSAADEMCQIAIVHTPGNQNISCKQVASSDGFLN